MLFDGWDRLAQAVAMAGLAYAGVVALLRLTGKRALAKWNAFDFIVTIALGSSLATMILSSDVTLLRGLAAFAALLALQFVVTWLAVRTEWVRKITKSRPALLLLHGRFEEKAMRRERVTESEVRAAVRSSGYARMEDVSAVVLETDGSISVIGDMGPGTATALQDVFGWKEGRR